MRRHVSLVLPDGSVDESILLTDIPGIEDALDCKGAGDDAGISAYQLDVMRLGLSPAILADAVAAARLAVLDIMCAACPGRGRTSCPRPRTSNDRDSDAYDQVDDDGHFLNQGCTTARRRRLVAFAVAFAVDKVKEYHSPLHARRIGCRRPTCCGYWSAP